MLLSCHNSKKEESHSAEISKKEYKAIMRDLILAQKVQEVLASKDSLEIDPVALVYRQYGVDSIKLKKATDYYSRDPQFFADVFSEIKNELKMKLDSLEKNMDSTIKKKRSTDSIKVKKGVIDKIFTQKRKTPIPK